MIDSNVLAQFSGSEHFYPHWTGKLFFTEGVHYLMENGAAWLVDAIASYQDDPRITENEMLREIQFWTLTVKDNKGVLTCVADTGYQPAITQKIEYTDFPLPEQKIWVESNGATMMAMIPGER